MDRPARPFGSGRDFVATGETETQSQEMMCGKYTQDQAVVGSKLLVVVSCLQRLVTLTFVFFHPEGM